mgnify:CR=1 FL=1
MPLSFGKKLLIAAGVGFVFLVGAYATNKKINTAEIQRKSYFIGTRATFPFGVVEYTRLSGGTEIVFDRQFIAGIRSYNIDGDPDVDVIQDCGVFGGTNRLMVDSTHYETDKELFVQKSALLAEERRRYAGKF